MTLPQQFLLRAFQRFGDAVMAFIALDRDSGEFNAAISEIMFHARFTQCQPLQLPSQRRRQPFAHTHAKT